MVSSEALLGNLPPHIDVSALDILQAREGAPQLVVIDDHPTGSQSMSNIPVLTAWSPDHIRWALETEAPAIVIVTGARALAPAAAEDRYLEVVGAVTTVLATTGRKVDIVLRSDSSLRGHYPLDVDIAVNALESGAGSPIDGVLIVPSFPEARRIVVNSVAYASEWQGNWTPMGETRFSREPGFQYTSSDLRQWVSEKSRGRYLPQDVLTIDLATIRTSPQAVADVLVTARGAQPIVADAVDDDDLRVLALGALLAGKRGKRFTYRVGPPFIRALVGQPVHEPIAIDEISDMRISADVEDFHGLIVVGTPVPFTVRQVRELQQSQSVVDVPISVPTLLDARRAETVERAIEEAVEGLALSNVMIRLVDMPIRENTGDFTLDSRIARALNDVVFSVTKLTKLGFVVARGGSVVAPVAQALGIRRAIVRGPMLTGIVSLWEPLTGRIPGVPFVVYAGGVGDDYGLADVVSKLSLVAPPERVEHREMPAPQATTHLAMIGLGSRGFSVAARLAEKYSIRVWDVDESARARGRAEGLDVARSAVDAVEGVDVALIAIRRMGEVWSLIDGPNGIRSALKPGATVVVLMSMDLDDIRQLEQSLATTGVHVVDAPISGGGEPARRGEISIVVGGNPHVVEAIRPVLEQMGSTIVNAGTQVGNGQAMNAVTRVVTAVNLAGLAEGIELAKVLGLDLDATLGAISAGTAASFVAADRAERMIQASEGLRPQTQNRMDLMRLNLQVALEIARDSMVPTPMSVAADQLFLQAARELPPDADDSEVIRASE